MGHTNQIIFKNQPKIERRINVIQRSGLSKSNIYNKVKDGTFPPTIALGDRAVGFVSHEIDAVLQAMIEEQPPEQIKALVKELVAKRTANKGGITL
jgi:prophage regulatory protein